MFTMIDLFNFAFAVNSPDLSYSCVISSTKLSIRYSGSNAHLLSHQNITPIKNNPSDVNQLSLILIACLANVKALFYIISQVDWNNTYWTSKGTTIMIANEKYQEIKTRHLLRNDTSLSLYLCTMYSTTKNSRANSNPVTSSTNIQVFY